MIDEMESCDDQSWPALAFISLVGTLKQWKLDSSCCMIRLRKRLCPSALAPIVGTCKKLVCWVQIQELRLQLNERKLAGLGCFISLIRKHAKPDQFVLKQNSIADEMLSFNVGSHCSNFKKLFGSIPFVVLSL
jgi:hypothetical protein